MIEDEGELVLVASIPPLVVISLLAVFGYGLAAVVLSIVWFVGVAPLLTVFGDRLLEEDEETATGPL